MTRFADAARLARQIARAIGGIVDPHLAIEIEARRPVERAESDWPRKRARNSGFFAPLEEEARLKPTGGEPGHGAHRATPGSSDSHITIHDAA